MIPLAQSLTESVSGQPIYAAPLLRNCFSRISSMAKLEDQTSSDSSVGSTQHMDDTLRSLLSRSWSVMRRLRRQGIPVVPRSVPVLYFGNLAAYMASGLRVITVALNPSRDEFPDGSPAQRFPSATERSRDRHFSALDGYFEHDPLWRWFKHFDVILAALGTGYRAGRPCRAMHTDLCTPVATDPTYTGLPRHQQRELERQGIPLWQQLAELLDPDVIVMSGGPAMRDRVPIFANASWQEVFRGGKKSVSTSILHAWGKQRLGVFGWTVQVPFGALTCDERREAGLLLNRMLKCKAGK